MCRAWGLCRPSAEMNSLLALALLSYALESPPAPGFLGFVPIPRGPEKRFPCPSCAHLQKISWKREGPPDNPAPQRHISFARNRPDFLHGEVAAKSQRPRSEFATLNRALPNECRSTLPARKAPGAADRPARYSALLSRHPLQIQVPDLIRAPAAIPRAEIWGTGARPQIGTRSF